MIHSFFGFRKHRKSSASQVLKRGLRGLELLEQRTLLSVTAQFEDVARSDFDAGWLAAPDSEEYLQAIIRERELLGWVIETPRLLENGNWYLGPAGESKGVYYPNNVAAADTINADQLRAGEALGLNLSGAGVTVGMWSAGGVVRASHQELAGRVTVVDAAPISSHATHVAGTIAATGLFPAARGMANGVTIRSRDTVDYPNELVSDAGLIDIANHSYGFRPGWTIRDVGIGFGLRDTWEPDRGLNPIEDPDFGKYDTVPQTLDQTLFNNADLLSVWSVGNDRNDIFTDRMNDGQYVAFFSQDPGGIGFTGRWVVFGSCRR